MIDIFVCGVLNKFGEVVLCVLLFENVNVLVFLTFRFDALFVVVVFFGKVIGFIILSNVMVVLLLVFWLWSVLFGCRGMFL